MRSLISASKNGNLKEVKDLLEASIYDIDKADKDGWTALMWASEYGHMDIVKLLVDEGAELDETLFKASAGGHLRVVKELLRNGADVNARNYGMISALGKASSNGHIDVVNELLENGADANYGHGRRHWTPLILASTFDHSDVVKLLIEKGGARVDAVN
jgi:serine/threonine-protein phosphatase 6 regulatory ankyrin repeat subunit B